MRKIYDQKILCRLKAWLVSHGEGHSLLYPSNRCH